MTTTPIQEALLELTFAPQANPNDAWDWRRVYALHNSPQLQPLYNGPMEVPFTGRVSIQLGLPHAEIQLPQAARVQLWSEDRQRLLALGSEGLSIHALSPFPGWSTFQSQILTTLESYCRVMEAEPLAVPGLRFINRWLLPQGPQEAARIFPGAHPPVTLPGARHQHFLQRHQLAFLDETGQEERQLQVQQMTLQERGQSFAIVDITARHTTLTPILKLQDALDPLYKLLVETFQQTTTPEARRDFNLDV